MYAIRSYYDLCLHDPFVPCGFSGPENVSNLFRVCPVLVNIGFKHLVSHLLPERPGSVCWHYALVKSIEVSSGRQSLGVSNRITSRVSGNEPSFQSV